jgi:hypothetical protein
VYVDGQLAVTLRGEHVVRDFLRILDEYVETRYPAAVAASPEAGGSSGS